MNKTQNTRVRKVINHEIPNIGTVLIHKTRPKDGKGVTLYAKIVKISPEKGIGILYNGQIYETMSAAARAAGGYMVDGWIYWKQKKKRK